MAKDNVRKVTRRDFLKGTAVGAAGLATTAVIGGCQPTTQQPTPCPTCEPCPTPQAGAAEKASWEVPPPPIPEKDIKGKEAADVVVVGAGVAGLCAALSAAEAGAKVIMVEKGSTYMAHGGWNGVIGSRLHKAKGIEIDKEAVIAEIMRWGAYRVDQRLVKLWADESGAVMDWLLDMAEADGIETTIESDVQHTEGWYKHYPTAVNFMPGMQATLAGMLEKHALAKGVTIHYETPAVRLLREGKGRVNGVIAQTPEGDYKQFDARKAVILCTGGYECNPEMLQRYIGFRGVTLSDVSYTPPQTTGDGHKMGLWVGAAMDEAPHCPMLFDVGGLGAYGLPGLFKLPRQPWLNVNLNGERYMNEDLPYGFTCNQDQLQPGHVKWVIWDDNWKEDLPKMGGVVCERMVESPGAPPPDVLGPQMAMVDMALEKGLVLKADTLDELAQKMQVPVETFKATVARYNELVQLGKDLDFGKNPKKLTAIAKPPFYACKLGVSLLVTLSGLKVNTRLQVLDTERKVIPGLYAAGNVSGGFFANDYPITVIGVSHGRALTFGRLAGLHAAAEQV